MKNRYPATPDQARVRLAELATEQRHSLAGLSRLIGRNDGYLARHVTRGVPKVLAVADRAMLARFFGVDVRELGDLPDA